MWNNKRVSIIFPAYNEAGNIGAAVSSFAAQQAVDEIIVVDNNSHDKTGEIAAAIGASVVKETKQGYGYALQRGMREASGQYIILAEPDGTFQATDVYKLLAYAPEFDMVCGTRTTMELIWEGANMRYYLRWGNWLVAKLLEILFSGPSLSDCGCTMRLIRRSAWERIHEGFKVGGSHFLPEMVMHTLVSGLRVIEVPVYYKKRVGESKITGSLKTAVYVGIRMILLILSYRLRTVMKQNSLNTTVS